MIIFLLFCFSDPKFMERTSKLQGMQLVIIHHLNSQIDFSYLHYENILLDTLIPLIFVPLI